MAVVIPQCVVILSTAKDLLLRPARHWSAVVALMSSPSIVTAQTTAIVNVNVVDVRTAVVRPRMTVVVGGDRITQIGPVDSVAVPAGAQRVDAAGAFLIPGLADMHAHFVRSEDLRVFLAYGVTLVQYLNASTEVLDWRDSVATGRALGPELHPCQGAIGRLDSVEQARRTVADAVIDGFDCIKPYDQITNDAFRTLTGESRQRGVRTVAHIPRNLTWEQALAARPSAIAHAEEFLYSPITTDLALDTLVSQMRDSKIALVSTLTTYDLITRQVAELPELMRMPELAYASPVHRRMWTPQWNHYFRDFKPARLPNLRGRLVFQRDLLRRLDSAGVRILAGTDAGNLFTLVGSSLHDELDQLVRSGLTPAAALRAATIAPAEFLGRDKELGTVEVGKRADLVLVYGNPLRDITNTRLIAGVMRSGRWFPRDSLRAILDGVRVTFGNETAFFADVDKDGVRSALDKAAQSGYMPPQPALNELAYQFWRVHHDTASADVTFRANVRLHAGDWLAHASLGEWLEFIGNKAEARAETEIALRTRPKDRDMLAQLARLTP